MAKDFSQIVPDAERFDAKLRSGLQQAVQSAIAVATMAARGEHAWKDRTGDTRESIEPTIEMNAHGASASLKAEGNAARLAAGTEAHRIDAKNARFLRFEIGGTLVFRKSVQHPGTAPDPYLDQAAEKAGEQLVSQALRELDEAFSG